MRKVLSMALMLMMVLTLLAVPAMAANVESYNVNVTEKQPYLGTVTAPAFVAGGSTTITVTPEEGYYLYSAKLDGAEIKDSFAKANGVYTYTLDGTDVTADPNLVISYGEYDVTEHITGGDLADSETALEIVTPYSGSYTVTHVTTEGNGDTNSVQISKRAYLEGPTGKAPGDEYTVSFDIKGVSSVKVWPHNDKGILPDHGNVVSYTFSGLTASEWNRVSFRVIITEGGNRFVSAIDASGAYVDNVSITSMVEGNEAEASVYYNVNVTEKQPDCGTVTAPAFEEGTGTTITVTPEEGYYLYSAKLDGAEIKDSFAKANGVYTYTLDGTDVTADPNLVISYGEYDVTEHITGGDLADSETALEIVTPYTSSHSVSYVTTEGNGDTSSVQVTTGRVYLEGPTGKAPGDEYTASFDIKGATSVKVWPHNDKGTLPDYGNAVNHTFSNLTASEWTRISVRVVLTEGGNRFVLAVNATAGSYIDNVSITTVAEGGEVPVDEPVTPPAPTEFDVTITAGANANASVSAATSEGEAVNFTVAPKFGYYIQSITIGGTPFNGFDAYKGGTYSTGAIEADTAIVVTVAELSANTEDGVSTAVATLPAVFAEAGEAPVTFGKVLADVATVDEFGIYLTKGGEGVTSAKTEMGPHFKAFYNVNGQYAIEFQGLEAGEYVAKTYVKVAGEITYGIATTFTVE